MKRLVPVLFLVVGVGCGSQPDESSSPKTNVPIPPTESKPAESKPAEAKADPERNPSRINQLNTLRQVDFVVKGKTIQSWVMDDQSKTQEGMMFLTDKDVRNDQGMLFVFKDVRKPDDGFWMHNTLIPLDIVYIDSKKTVVAMKQGKVQDDTSLKPGKEYQYVLEVKGGQAAPLGLTPGTTVQFPSDVVGKD